MIHRQFFSDRKKAVRFRRYMRRFNQHALDLFEDGSGWCVTWRKS